jgi:hypothetical protein
MSPCRLTRSVSLRFALQPSLYLYAPSISVDDCKDECLTPARLRMTCRERYLAIARITTV